MHVAFQFFKVFFSMKNAFGELLVTPNKKRELAHISIEIICLKDDVALRNYIAEARSEI